MCFDPSTSVAWGSLQNPSRIQQKEVYTPFYLWLPFSGHVECVRHIVATPGIKCIINTATAKGNSALYGAALSGEVECVRVLLGAEGVDANHTNTNEVDAPFLTRIAPWLCPIYRLYGHSTHCLTGRSHSRHGSITNTCHQDVCSLHAVGRSTCTGDGPVRGKPPRSLSFLKHSHPLLPHLTAKLRFATALFWPTQAAAYILMEFIQKHYFGQPRLLRTSFCMNSIRILVHLC